MNLLKYYGNIISFMMKNLLVWKKMTIFVGKFRKNIRR